MKLSAPSTVWALAVMMCLVKTAIVDAKRRSIRGSKQHEHRDLIFSNLVRHNSLQGRAEFGMDEGGLVGLPFAKGTEEGKKEGKTKAEAKSKAKGKGKGKAKAKPKAKAKDKTGPEIDDVESKGKSKDSESGNIETEDSMDRP